LIVIGGKYAMETGLGSRQLNNEVT
jgi:hypothetical protein